MRRFKIDILGDLLSYYAGYNTCAGNIRMARNEMGKSNIVGVAYTGRFKKYCDVFIQNGVKQKNCPKIVGYLGKGILYEVKSHVIVWSFKAPPVGRILP